MKRSKIALAPKAVREQLEQILIERGFSGYAELEAWCKEQGIDTSKSALQRFGKSFEDRINAIKISTEQARAVVAASPDDDNAMNDSLIRLVQEEMFSVLIDMTPEQRAKINLGTFAKGVANLGRASVQQKKYANEVKKRTNDTAEAVSKVAKKGGLSDETVEAIKRQILGIA